MRAFLLGLALGPLFALADEVGKYKITKDVDEADVRLQKYFYCLDDQKTELEKFIRSSTPEIRTFKEVKIRFGGAELAAGGQLQNDGRTLVLSVQPGGGVPPPGVSVKAGCEFWTTSQIGWFLKEAHLKQIEKARYERTYEKQNRKRTPKVDGRLVDVGAGAGGVSAPPVPESASGLETVPVAPPAWSQ